MTEADRATTEKGRTLAWLTVIVLAAFDGAVMGAVLNQAGWTMHEAFGWFRWNTMGWLWGLAGAAVGVAAAAIFLAKRRPSLRATHTYRARPSWLRVAALAIVIQAAAGPVIVDLLAGVTLAVVLTVGYFIEGNALFKLAVNRFRLFAALIGTVMGGLAGAVLNSPAWLVGGWSWAAAGAVLGGLVGWFWWGRRPPAYERRLRIPEKAAPAIFLAPALVFVGITLVAPSIRTIYLSFFGRNSEQTVGWGNYREVWADDRIVNFVGFGDIHTARLAVALIGLSAVALIVTVARSLVRLMGRNLVGRDGASSGGRRRARPGLAVVVALMVTAALTAAAVDLLALTVASGAVAGALGLLAAVAAAAMAVEPLYGWFPPRMLRRTLQVAVGAIGAGLLLSVWLAGEALGSQRFYQAGVFILVVLGLLALVRGAAFLLSLRREPPAGGEAPEEPTGGISSTRPRTEPLLSRWLQRPVAVSDPLPTFALTLAAALVLLGAVGSMSGVLWNNVFWIVFVAGGATGFGLAIAVLADRARGESLAKSFIFMPMAISFVGASIIWRFVYEHSPGSEQFGLLNAAVVNMGGDPQTWVQDRPWNTLFLIAIMIWIQTGFAMVIFSAAIKGVPDELREAARIDGASEVQTFWRVVLPHIRATVVVVVTTLIVTVLKVYDLVQVMTGGSFGTNVIANQMFDEVFSNRDYGRGAALATLLFLGVLPLMVLNIRRVHRQEEVR